LVCEEVIDSDYSSYGYDSDQDPEYNIIFPTAEQKIQVSDSSDHENEVETVINLCIF